MIPTLSTPAGERGPDAPGGEDQEDLSWTAPEGGLASPTFLAPDGAGARPAPRSGSGRPALWNALARAAIGLALVVLFAPGPGPAVGPGIDASFLWGIDALAAAGAAHGRDVAFPFGPLGPYLYPRPSSGVFGQALAVRWLLHGLWAAGLAVLLRRRVGTGEAVAFAALTLLAGALALSGEGQLLLTLATLLAAAFFDRGRAGAAAGVVAAGLAPVLALMRLSLGVQGLAMTAVFLALALARPATRRRGLAAAAALAVSSILAVLLAFPTPGDAWRWLGAQAELARGFGSAMGITGLRGEIPAALLCLAVFGLLLARAVARGGAARDYWLVVLPAVLLAFKHGFVRQDRHVMTFVSLLLALLAPGLLAGGGPRETRFTLVASLALLAFLVPIGIARVPERRPSLDLPLGRRGVNSFRNLIERDQVALQLTRRGRRNLRPSRLARPFVAEAHRRGVTADVVPWELSVIAANDLRWVPSPTLQLYTCYTRDLDAWTARHFAGPRAPDLLLAEYRAIDGRNMTWDTPRTWRAILARYAPLVQRPREGMLALLQRPRRATWTSSGLGEAPLSAEKWVPVPAAPTGWTAAHLDLPLSVKGRLATLLLRLPAIELELAFAGGGKTQTYRLVPETVDGGLFVSPTPETIEDLDALFRRTPGGRRAVRLRLTGPGAEYVGEDARVLFRSWTLR